MINRLVPGSLVYYLWQERNLRLFQSHNRPFKQIILLIEEAIRYKLMGMKMRRNSRVLQALEVWNVSLELPLIQSNEVVV